MAPQTIDGKYQIVRLLGQGGMGAVYEAKNTETSRRVAVKVIASGLVTNSVDATARFKLEAKAAGAIETQHVVQVLDAGSDPATQAPYIVMELLAGEDLKQLLERNGPLAPEVALRIAAQACVGLQAAHGAGVIHRDIKSANLFLTRREGGEIVVKIVDFGIAKVIAQEAAAGEKADLTRTGSIIGSPRYVSPEQAKGTRDVSVRSDLWSLGVVLYEMLTGVTPQAQVEGVFMIMTAICSTPAPPVQERAPWVSPEQAALVHKLLQIDPSARFADAAELLQALHALLPNGLSITESMLAPLPPEMRSAIASADQKSIRRAAGVSGTVTGASDISLNAITGPGVAPSRPMLRPAIALPLLVAAVGLVVYLLVARPAALPPAGELASAASPTVSSPAPAATPTAPVEARSARLAIEPADANVEVDGRSVVVKEGGVELEGAVGSVHDVRVVKGAQTAQADVAITARGAVPAVVRLSATAPSPSPKPARSGSGASVARPGPATSAAPAAEKPKALQADTKFE